MSNQVKEMAVRLKPLLNEGDVGCKWESSLDKIFSPGNYVVEIDHTGNDVGLPVEFCGTEHYIVGNLIVTDSGTAGPKQHDRVTGQSLTFTTRESKTTKVFTRTFTAGKWGEWHSLVEAATFDKITTTDELISTVTTISNNMEVLKGSGDGSIAAVVNAAMDKGRALAKRDLFVAAGALYNDTDAPITRTAPWGENVQHLAGYYYLNGLGDITEEQMTEIYNAGVIKGGNLNYFYRGNTTIRTNIPRKHKGGYGSYSSASVECVAIFFGASTLERVNLTGETIYASVISYAFYACRKLKVIVDVINLIGAKTTSNLEKAFNSCPLLERVKLAALRCHVSFMDSPLLNKESLLYMIQNAEPITTITITLHADAYARLESDADIVAALEAQPQVSLVSA